MEADKPESEIQNIVARISELFGKLNELKELFGSSYEEKNANEICGQLLFSIDSLKDLNNDLFQHYTKLYDTALKELNNYNGKNVNFNDTSNATNDDVAAFFDHINKEKQIDELKYKGFENSLRLFFDECKKCKTVDELMLLDVSYRCIINEINSMDNKNKAPIQSARLKKIKINVINEFKTNKIVLMTKISGLSDDQIETEIFQNHQNDIQTIRKRFRYVTLCFHPDKFIEKDLKNLGENVLEKLMKIKDSLVKSFKKIEKTYFLFKQNVAKLIIATIGKNHKEMLDLRIEMAKCLHQARMINEAKLVAITTLKLVKNQCIYAKSDVQRMEKLFEEIEYKNFQISNLCIDGKIKTTLFYHYSNYEIDDEITSLIKILLASNKEIKIYKANPNEIHTESLREKLNEKIFKYYEDSTKNDPKFSEILSIIKYSTTPLTLIEIGQLCRAISLKNNEKEGLFQNTGNEQSKLSSIIFNSIVHYENKNYKLCIECLSQFYDSKKEKSLIKYENESLEIKPDEIIECLREFGIRPHGIAYLLNCISHSIGVAQMESKNSENNFCEMAKKISSVSEKIDKAKKLDDEKYMQFETQLEEMRIIALLNTAETYLISRSISETLNNINQAKSSIIGTKFDFSFISLENIQNRICKLEEILWIVYHDSITYEFESDSIADQYEASQRQIRPNRLVEEAENFRISAKHNIKPITFDYFKNLNEASILYKDIINKTKDPCSDERAYLNYIKCLIGLHQYADCIKFINDNKKILYSNSITEDVRFQSLLFFSLAHRKTFQYVKALQHIKKALECNHSNPIAKKEKEVLNKLVNKEGEKIYNVKPDSGLDNSTNNGYKCKNVYKVLAIDGGGIFGVIPAVWLNEIEKRTHKPISSIFDVVSGTSTGAIIASGLTVPVELGKTEPKYTAYDFIELFKNESTNIFKQSPVITLNTFNHLQYPKYDDSRKNVFQKYFNSYHLNHAINKILIPCSTLQKEYHLFSNFNNNEENISFVDALMATTATPTYFDPYVINNEACIDGSYVANNPSHVVYNEINYSNKVAGKEIFVLSLGTGSYIPQSFTPDAYHHSLSWAYCKNEYASLLENQKIDKFMSNFLKNRYHRWQVFLDERIDMDETDEKKITQLMDSAAMYLEEQYDSETNTMNKLLEQLDKEPN